MMHQPDQASASGPGRQRSSTGTTFVPRLLAFYHDVVDEDVGTIVGWRTVAWGLVLADGSAVSVPVEGPMAVTIWASVDDAAAALDAFVDTPDPRARLADQPARPTQPAWPAISHAPTALPPPAEGVAAQPACPGRPPEGGEVRDGPLGRAADPAAASEGHMS